MKRWLFVVLAACGVSNNAGVDSGGSGGGGGNLGACPLFPATVEKAAPGPEKRRALGRGLESLLPGPRPVPGAAPAIHSVAAAAPGVIGELQAQASPPA